jgi:hypothetical protein
VESWEWKAVEGKFFLHSTLYVPSTTFQAPPSVEKRAEDHTQDGQCHPGQQIDHIMVSQVEGGENESADDGQKEIKEELFVTMGQV